MSGKFLVTKKEVLNESTRRIWIFAPLIAAKARAGHFAIVRSDEKAERIPLTISSSDGECISLIYQIVGEGTGRLDEVKEGGRLADVAGPLGRATETSGIRSAAVVGGGLGCAIALPVAKALHDSGVRVDLIGGFKTKGMVILEDELKAACSELYLCTDDGSYGYNGMVTEKLQELIEAGEEYDRVYALGPLVMMKFVSRLTGKYDIPTIVSMNPIMIDGTGMCGGCRVTVGGEVKFACVDGPDFDGHLVDFDETIARASTYKRFEDAHRAKHACRLEGMSNV